MLLSNLKHIKMYCFLEAILLWPTLGSEPEKQTLSSFLQNLAGLHPPSRTDLMERENESCGRACSCVPGCLERFLLLDQRLHHELEPMN